MARLKAFRSSIQGSRAGRFNALRSPTPPASQTLATVERASARERGYTTKWDKASKAHLNRFPFCRGCQALGRSIPAVLTDHVVPHRGDNEIFWDHRRWQSSCAWHHNAVKQELERQFDAGFIGEADLWLDSAKARDLALRLAESRGRGGVDP